MAAPKRAGARVGWFSSPLAQIDVIASAVLATLTIGLIARDQGGYFPTSWGWSAIALVAVVVVWFVAGARSDMGRLDVVFLLGLLLLAGWIGLSIAWSVDPAQSVLELERTLVLVAGCSAFLVLSRRHGTDYLTFSLLVAIAAVCGYSLSTRLFPTAGGFNPHDATAGYRLFQPVGYWNALGAFATIGILLAFGLITEPTTGRARRVAAALAAVVLPVTLFFTFSRGAWAALACGFLVAVAASPHRLRLIGEALLFAGPPAVGVLLASRSSALTESSATLASASRQGHHLAALLVGLGLVSAGLAAAVPFLERRVSLGRRRRHACGSAVVAVSAILVAGVVVRGGGPVSLAHQAYESFIAPAPSVEASNLNTRLLSLNGNGRAQMWRVAVDSVHSHWLGGTGAGSFERNWDRSPKANEAIRDAHGLYLETLSELGIIGLVLLVGLLLVPLVAGVTMRRVALAPAVTGAYAAFVLHNGIDWDWELSGITLAGLLTGCLLLVMRRTAVERQVSLSARATGGALAAAVAAVALVAAIGNAALAHAQAANRDHRYAAAAADAALARRWMWWSPEPLKALGEARLRQGDASAARASFQKATSIDPRDWQSWLDLAAGVKGEARSRAVLRARELYPTSPEIEEFLDSEHSGR